MNEPNSNTDTTTDKKPPFEGFYLVLKDRGLNQRMNTKKHHPDKESALIEVERLSKDIGGTFYVAKVFYSKKTKVKVRPLPSTIT